MDLHIAFYKTRTVEKRIFMFGKKLKFSLYYLSYHTICFAYLYNGK